MIATTITINMRVAHICTAPTIPLRTCMVAVVQARDEWQATGAHSGINALGREEFRGIGNT